MAASASDCAENRKTAPPMSKAAATAKLMTKARLRLIQDISELDGTLELELQGEGEGRSGVIDLLKIARELSLRRIE